MSQTETTVELKEGQIVRVPSDWSDDGELFVIAREKDYGTYIWGLEVIPHYDSKGRIHYPGQHTGIWNEDWTDDDEGRPCFIEKVLSQCVAAEVPCLGLAKQVTEDGFTWWQSPKFNQAQAPVFHENNDGLPLCGAKVSRNETKEAGRWDPWNKVSCPERREVSVWLPATHEPTCQKCSKRS